MKKSKERKMLESKKEKEDGYTKMGATVMSKGGRFSEKKTK